MMPVDETRKIEEILQGGIQNHLSTSILEEVDLLINKFESECIYNVDIELEVVILIQKLDEMANLPLKREALGHLLKVRIDDCQKLVIEALKKSIHQIYLDFDIEKQQSREIVQLEQYVSHAISQSLDSNSVGILFSLIDLYEIILERLWLLPLLSVDRSSYAIIVEENAPNIIENANRWLIIASKQHPNEERVQMTIFQLRRALKRIISSPDDISKEMDILKLELKPTLFVLAHIGDIYLKIGEFQKAVNCYVRNLDMLFNSIKGAKYAKDNKLLALNTLLYCIDWSDLLQELEGAEYTIKTQLGTAYLSLSKIEQAIECFVRCLEIAKKQKKASNAANAYVHIANAYHLAGNNLSAIEHYEKSLEIAENLKDESLKGKIYYNLGNTYKACEQSKKAIECYELSLEIAFILNDKVQESKLYNNCGIAYRFLGEYSKAIEFYEKGLTIALEHRDKVLQMELYANLANSYISLGNYPKAIELQNKSLPIASLTKNIKVIGTIYGNLAHLSTVVGKYIEAIEFQDKSLELAKSIGDELGRQLAYCRLASISMHIGEYEKSITYCNKALTIGKKVGDQQTKGMIYGQLGDIYRALENIDESMKYQEKNLKIAKKIEHRPEQASALLGIGEAWCSRGQYKKAIKNIINPH